MKRIAWLKYAIVLHIFFYSTFSSHANERILFGTEIYAPYNFIDEETGQLTGFSYDVVQALIHFVGDQDIVEIKVFPWARIYYMAQHMENVAIFSIIHSEQRSSMFKWAGTLYYSDSYIWKMAERTDIQVENKQDLKRYQTAVLNDGVDQQILMRWYDLSKRLHLLPVSSANQKLLMLFNGHVDLSEYGEMPLRWKMREMSLDYHQVEKVFAIPEMAPLSLAFSPLTSDEIVNRYRQALNAIKENGVYDQILEKWLLPVSKISNAPTVPISASK